MVIQSIDALCRVSGWDGRTDAVPLILKKRANFCLNSGAAAAE